jgi:1,2-diacylglycerol 3-alpha-glucosyltransferase
VLSNEMDDLLAVIYMNLGPYHLARMEALAKLHPHLLVIEIGSEQGLYPWRPRKQNLFYKLETLFRKNVEDVSARDQKIAIKSCLQKYQPKSVVVSGYRHPAMRAAANWARKKNLSCVLLFVSTKIDHRRVWWRECFKRLFLYEKISHFAVAGQRSAQYARNLGTRQDMISIIGNVVDNRRIMALARSFQSEKATLSKRLSLPENFFLYVGRLSVEKNLVTLIDAFSDYLNSGGRWDLVIIGSGPDENILKRRADDKTIKSIHFLGWKQFDELIAHYSLAKAVILPSLSEPWGLVVNEAMCCGLPVLVSRNCGCVPELCQDKVNALMFDPLDKKSLTQSMLSLSSSEFDVDAMGRKSLEIISSYTPKNWAQGLLKTIEI